MGFSGPNPAGDLGFGQKGREMSKAIPPPPPPPKKKRKKERKRKKKNTKGAVMKLGSRF